MEAMRKKLHEQKWYETVYKIAVGIKGFDGLVELIAGLGLAFSPMLVHNLLGFIIGHANTHHNAGFRFLAEYVGGVDAKLLSGGLVFLAVFLILHGIVKLILVYCLLREIIKAYPIALIVLVLFLIAQIIALITSPGIGVALLTLLDVVIIWLVWGEYKELKERAAKKQAAASAKN